MKEINQLSLPASSPFSVALSLYLKSLNLSGLDTAMNKAIQLMRTQFRNNRHWPVGLSPLQLRLLHISPPCPRVSNSTLQLHLLPVGVWLFFFLALLVVFLFVCFLVLQVSRDFTIPLRVLDLDDRQGFTARSALRYKKKEEDDDLLDAPSEIDTPVFTAVSSALIHLERAIDNMHSASSTHPTFDPLFYLALSSLPLTYPWPILTVDLKSFLPLMDRHVLTHLVAA